MADWLLETGLYLLGIALIPVAGLLLICWYDMRGSLPSLECPECGYDAGQERRLRLNRRGWRRMVVGAVLVLLSCYPLTIVAGRCREQLVIRSLTKRGGTLRSALRIGPRWLVDRLPESVRLFDRVSSVGLGPLGTDADLRECGKLSHLGLIHVPSTKVTDAGLVHLKGLSHLRALHLPGTQVTDAGLMHLKGLTQLSFLDLSGTQVTDAGLKHLHGLTGLKEVRLVGTQITDAGFVELKNALVPLAVEWKP